MTRRYFHAELPINGGSVSLNESESQHASRVMRVQPGDQIELFDGAGRQCAATVLDVSRRACHCQAEPAMAVDREPTVSLELGIALPKPDRAKELIERLTELGVSSVTPIVAQRTQRPPSAGLLEKLERLVVESCKQSGRNVLMQIGELCDLMTFIESTSAEKKLIAHPDGVEIGSVGPMPNCVAVLVGPEGGWTDDEVSRAVDADFTKVGLGARIYRIETAAVVIAARVID